MKTPEPDKSEEKFEEPVKEASTHNKPDTADIVKPDIKKADPVNKTTHVTKKTLSIPDVNELKNRTGQTIAPRKVKKEEEKKDIVERQSPFSVNRLKQEWDAFTSLLKKEGKDNEYNLMTQDYELLDDHTITIQISNTIEQDILVRFKTELLKHLRDNLDNDQIKIDTSLKKVEKSEKIYTNTDKFNHLAKKNPNLIKLKNKFGLDTEF